MKRTVTLLLTGLLTACNSPNNNSQAENLTGNIENCPTPTETPVPLASPPENGLPNPLNFFTQTVTGNQDTIRFQTRDYDLVYCRGNGEWTLQPGTHTPTPDTSPTGEKLYDQLADPPYQTVEFQGETYQYRTRLDPNPFENMATTTEAERVLFELLPPNQDTPITRELYTVQDVRNAEIGFSLAYPDIINHIPWGDKILWSISAPQGEGFTGIATLLTYHPDTQAIAVVQPDPIQNQIITDLAATDSDPKILWMTTKTSGEGNPYLPGLGLVRYDPNPQTITPHHIRNSPLIGAIPTHLWIDGEELWVSTGNGICQVQWQNSQNRDSWTCWRYAVLADPPAELDLYATSGDPEAATTLEPVAPLEILWKTPLLNPDATQYRYEIYYEEGFVATVEEGKSDWSDQDWDVPPYFAPVYWPGRQWHWNGNHFQRGFDQVSLNVVGGGPIGIGTTFTYPENPPNTHAIRGDLTLLELTENQTTVRHHSGWIAEEGIEPYITILPVDPVENPQPNPLEEERE